MVLRNLLEARVDLGGESRLSEGGNGVFVSTLDCGNELVEVRCEGVLHQAILHASVTQKVRDELSLGLLGQRKDSLAVEGQCVVNHKL